MRGDDADETLRLAQRGRSALKREGERLDADPALRDAVIALARNRGIDLPDEAARWPGKRLLRRSLGRDEPARERSNFLHRDEGFVCARCGAEVPPGGAVVRDHCPRCLWSLHLDEVPGDRAAGCGAALAPIGAELSHGRWTLTWRCERCGALRRNREHPDDDPAALARLSALAGERAVRGR